MTPRLLGLTANAAKVLNAIKNGLKTPVQISNETGVSRPAVYSLIEQLEKQGLVVVMEGDRGKEWKLASKSQINNLLTEIKKEILSEETKEELLYQEKDVQIKIYRGRDSITSLMQHIFQKHKNEVCIGIQGDNVYEGWKNLIGIETIHEINKSIKKNSLVNQAIVPKDNFLRGIETMGVEWAKNFEGRAYRANEIDEKYFKHKAEMFLFKDAVYLLSMNEELVIEIKHSEIQKMLLLLLQYVQDTSRLVDGNGILRELMTAKDN
ncbi:MAG: MarR family transcriptional regulator [Sediminibacterium sp.]